MSKIVGVRVPPSAPSNNLLMREIFSQFLPVTRSERWFLFRASEPNPEAGGRKFKDRGTKSKPIPHCLLASLPLKLKAKPYRSRPGKTSFRRANDANGK